MDLYIKELMNKHKEKQKDRFDKAIAKYAEEYADSLPESEYTNDPFLTPTLKRARLIAEYEQSVKLPELSSQLSQAFKIVGEEGINYLDKAHYDALVSIVIQAAKIFDKMDFTSPLSDNFLEQLNFSNEEMFKGLFTLASAKFNENQWEASLALFALLTTLYPENGELWFRLGIVAQRLDKIPLALKAYANSMSIQDGLIRPHLFSAECYLITFDKEAAKRECFIAKELLQLEEKDSAVWGNLMEALEQELNN